MSHYLMVIVNEETFEEQFQFRLSRLNVIIASTLLITTLSVGIFLIIAYTSVKEYIPGYDSSEIRKNAIENLFMADSLINIYDKNNKYLNSVREVLNGDLKDESLFFLDIPNDSANNEATFFKKQNKVDSILRSIVDQEDKYNLTESTLLNPNIFLTPPANGPISQGFNIKEEHYAVDIVLEKNASVKSVADGTVIFAEWTAQTGHVIMVKHTFGLLSVYKHNSVLNKRQGEFVVAGEVIAMAGNTGEYSTGWHLHFELWLEGYPMDPINFFNF